MATGYLVTGESHPQPSGPQTHLVLLKAKKWTVKTVKRGVEEKGERVGGNLKTDCSQKGLIALWPYCPYRPRGVSFEICHDGNPVTR